MKSKVCSLPPFADVEDKLLLSPVEEISSVEDSVKVPFVKKAGKVNGYGSKQHSSVGLNASLMTSNINAFSQSTNYECNDLQIFFLFKIHTRGPIEVCLIIYQKLISKDCWKIIRMLTRCKY